MEGIHRIILFGRIRKDITTCSHKDMTKQSNSPASLTGEDSLTNKS